MARDNSNGTSAAISRCGVTAIGTALQSWCAAKGKCRGRKVRKSVSNRQGPVKLADGVTATVAGQKVTVKGKLGEFSFTMQVRLERG